MKLNQIKGLKLDIILAEALMKEGLQDLTTRVRKIDGYDIVNNRCRIKSGYFNEFFSYKDADIYTALQTKLYVSMNYITTHNNKLWQAKIGEQTCTGRTPAEALSRVVCCKIFGKDEITKQDIDMSIFKTVNAVDCDDDE